MEKSLKEYLDLFSGLPTDFKEHCVLFFSVSHAERQDYSWSPATQHYPNQVDLSPHVKHNPAHGNAGS
jgi:hypothetical protein